MGFQKKHVLGRSEDLDFFIGDFLANPYLRAVVAKNRAGQKVTLFDYQVS
jgi:hypothetical protein